MFNRDEQIQIALEVMGRLQPELAVPPPPDKTEETIEPQEQPSNPTLPTPYFQLPSLQALLRRIGPQPAYSALIGLCEDGLPFMFDLSDAGPGSILIAGDRQSGKTRLLQAILSSINSLNGPDQVCYYLISPKPAEWGCLSPHAHCQDVLPPDERSTTALLLDFAEVANRRRSGRDRGPVTILAVDDLATLDHFLDDKGTRYFQWLLENGPQVGIWTVATLEASQARRVDRRLVPAFGTRLIGKIASSSATGHLTGYLDPVVETLESGMQFCILFGNEWIRFWIPEIR